MNFMNRTKSRNIFGSFGVSMFAFLLVKYAKSAERESRREITLLFERDDLLSAKNKTFIANPIQDLYGPSGSRSLGNYRRDDSSYRYRTRSSDEDVGGRHRSTSRVFQRSFHEEAKPNSRNPYDLLDKRISRSEKRIVNIKKRFDKSSSKAVKTKVEKRLAHFRKELDCLEQEYEGRNLKPDEIRQLENRMDDIENSLFKLEESADDEGL